ncbi:MAG: hypothetical protein QOG15_2627 [Solirubrobacteraceae bacterium]|jgi:hypothetical protein|nr:hypothetical protein [Solirubrobacteraceae bacterium]
MKAVRRALGRPGARTGLARGLVAVGTRVGITPYNWRLLRSTRRLTAVQRLPCPPWQSRPPRAVSSADVALSERLIDAYSAALGGQPAGEQAEGMWRWIYDERQRGLATILERRDAPGLATALAAMFRKTFVLGLAPGSLVRQAESPIGRRIWRVKTLDGLVSLAHAIGAATVDGPEHARSAGPFAQGLQALVEGIEARLGFSIDASDVGAPCGLAVGERVLTLDAPEQIYASVRIQQAIESHLSGRARSAPRIVEIGGGYGATCMWLMRGGCNAERYVIVDLPIVNVLQGYFLSQVLGRDQVSLFGEAPARVVITPDRAVKTVPTPYDVLVNKDSMPEMPAAAVHAYLTWARTTCDGIFFSCNQESAAPFRGEPQVVVSEAVATAGGFVRVRRDESWVRRGYVEEIYVPAPDEVAA